MQREFLYKLVHVPVAQFHQVGCNKYLTLIFTVTYLHIEMIFTTEGKAQKESSTHQLSTQEQESWLQTTQSNTPLQKRAVLLNSHCATDQGREGGDVPAQTAVRARGQKTGCQKTEI